MAITGEIVELSSIPLHPTAEHLRNKAIEAKGTEDAHNKNYPVYDWQRLCHVFNMMRPGQSCLEVGPGRGYLSRMIAESGRYERFAAIDIVPRVLPKAVEFEVMSVGKLDFPDRSFDTVLCMEVLEHLDDETLESAVREIRRVCRDQLIMSVPYNEPLPLPKYHKQQFTEERIKRMFPKAKCSLLLKKPVMRVPWMLMEEERSGTIEPTAAHHQQAVPARAS